MGQKVGAVVNADIQRKVEDSVLEAIVVRGDLSKLTPAQRLNWYQARCEAAGLD